MSLFSTKIRQGKPAAPAQPPLLVVADESQGMRHRLPKWVHTRIQAVLPLSWGPTLPLGFLVSIPAFKLLKCIQTGPLAKWPHERSVDLRR